MNNRMEDMAWFGMVWFDFVWIGSAWPSLDEKLFAGWLKAGWMKERRAWCTLILASQATFFLAVCMGLFDMVWFGLVLVQHGLV